MNWNIDLNQELVDKYKNHFDQELVNFGKLLDGVCCLCNSTKVKDDFIFSDHKIKILRIFFAVMCEVTGRSLSIIESMDIMQIIMQGLDKGNNLYHHYIILHKLKSFDTSIFDHEYIKDVYDDHDKVLGSEAVSSHILNTIKEFLSACKSLPSKNAFLAYAHEINDKTKEEGFLNTVPDEQLASKILCVLSGVKQNIPMYGVEVKPNG